MNSFFFLVAGRIGSGLFMQIEYSRQARRVFEPNLNPERPPKTQFSKFTGEVKFYLKSII